MAKRDRALGEIKAARTRADRLLDRSAISSAQTILDEEVGNLERVLRKTYRGSAARAVDPSQMKRLRAAASAAVARAADRLERELDTASRVAVEESLRGLTRFAGRLTGTGGALEDESAFRAAAFAPRAALAPARGQALAAIQQEVDKAVRRSLLDVTLREDARMSDALDAITAAVSENWWRVERVIRTEASYAYNAAQVEGVKALGASHPGMMMRWTELIDDASGEPFDDRVAADSFAMHGQVAEPGKAFRMPKSLPSGSGLAKKSIARLIGQSWFHPPNRPNDRAVLTPWMPDWGIPAWRYKSGRRVYLQR